MRIADELRLRDALMASPTLGVSNVCPVVADEATTYPYIAYKRVNSEFDAWKRANGVYKMTVEVVVWSDDYDESIVVAERAMDVISAEHGMSIQNCIEGYEGGAYYQLITITME